jgi:hypothetical protein
MLHSKRALRKALMGSSEAFKAAQGRWNLQMKWWQLTKLVGKKWYWKWIPVWRIQSEVTP